MDGVGLNERAISTTRVMLTSPSWVKGMMDLVR